MSQETASPTRAGAGGNASGRPPAAYQGFAQAVMVTGEAVEIDVPAASIGTRILAGLVDLFLQAVLLVGGLLFTAFLAPDEALASVGAIVVIAGVTTLLPTAVLTLTGGRTAGKFLLGLRVVRDDGGPISFQPALIRSLVAIVEIWMLYGVPALFCALVNERSKRLGDFAAGTYVVRDNVRLTLPPPLTMPPHLQRWAAEADIAPLPPGTAVSIRQVLGRVHQFSPQARVQVVRTLADEVLALVAPPPPAGTHPEDFLAAVAVERRERDGRRLRREAEQRARLAGSQPPVRR